MSSRRLRLLVVTAVVVVGCATALFGVFLAWRIPREREEERRYFRDVRLHDGPHVTWLDDRTVKVTDYGFDARARSFTRSERTMPCADGARLAAAIDPNATLDCTPPASAPPMTVAAAPVVAAVSDVHGHYHHLVAMLRRAGVVDGRLDWVFGRNHLVVNGDVVDKGPEITSSLWLVKKLERQAEAAGGRVHYLLGNHEHLALTGASRILDRKYIDLTSGLGIEYSSLFSPFTELGRWIRQHGVAVRIDDTLFVHAGIAQAVLDSGLSLEALNEGARQTLANAESPGGPGGRPAWELTWGRSGVTWYRGYFDRSFPLGFWRALRGDLRQDDRATALVERVLQRYQARRIVVGHTETARVTPMFQGRLVAICQRMGMFDVVTPDTGTELLLIEGDRLTRVAANGRRAGL